MSVKFWPNSFKILCIFILFFTSIESPAVEFHTCFNATEVPFSFNFPKCRVPFSPLAQYLRQN
jgi:hypothetical protein